MGGLGHSFLSRICNKPVFCLQNIGNMASQVALVVKNPPANEGDIKEAGLIPGWEDPLEEGITIHSSILAWRIPCTEALATIQSTGSKRETTEMI